MSQDVRFKFLEEGQQYTLLVIEALPQDSGLYECVVRNSKGEARCRANLQVTLGKAAGAAVQTGAAASQATAPQILEPMQGVLVTEGQPGKFSVKLAAQPGMSF